MTVFPLCAQQLPRLCEPFPLPPRLFLLLPLLFSNTLSLPALAMHPFAQTCFRSGSLILFFLNGSVPFFALSALSRPPSNSFLDTAVTNHCTLSCLVLPPRYCWSPPPTLSFYRTATASLFPHAKVMRLNFD